MKLNLGCGETRLEGYRNLDGKYGDSIYPLEYEDDSVDEIRASHILEHFSHHEVPKVLAEWVRVLKDGGKLKLAVPNFETIAREYLAGKPLPVQGFVMGGQVDERDYHKAVFDSESLAGIMRAAGLRSIKPWQSDAKDCSSYAISLNLEGVKRRQITVSEVQAMKIGAGMSVPRLGFMDNFFCAFQTLAPLKIEMRKYTGAFWGQCLERTMEEWVKEGKDWILTIDYDTVWTREALVEMIELARDHPEADAIAPVQAHRTKKTPLMTMRDENGNAISQATRDTFQPDLTQIFAAHFGLTLIRVSSLLDIPHPWFHGQPQDDGTWGDKRIDDDVFFWKQWAEHGKTLFLANRVVIGHGEFMIRWPNEDFQTMYQHPSEFYQNGPPEDVWK